MNAYSPKGYGDRGPRPDGLTEMDRRNLRALLLTMFRREGTWIKVAHLLAFRRETVKGFYDGKNEGGIALARTIARAVDLSIEDALDGRFIITAKNEIRARKPSTAKRGGK